MPLELLYGHHHRLSIPPIISPPYINSTLSTMNMAGLKNGSLQQHTILLRYTKRRSSIAVSKPYTRAISASLQPLDLTEDNVKQVLEDARVKFPQIFDSSDVGITGEAKLAELDGPFVKISLKGRFWHERSTVLARLANYLKQRIPEILEVDIEDEKQLDDSPENF